MDDLTRLVQEEIKRQYKSVRQFSFAVDIPLSTINSALHNGIGGSSFDTVLQICHALGIKAFQVENPFYLTDDMQQILSQYVELDDYGRHTISSVIQVEYDRCTAKGQIAAFGGRGKSVHVSSEQEAQAVDALRNIQKKK
ncbi:MAG: hypothetical protein GXW99_00475 [Clostridiales bacterium]|nr:hypothetical protein [Clostridiales bacterium]